MKVLILGNSITKHGYLEDVGWYNIFGMAATKEENDYAHILKKRINEIEPSEFIIENISDFELFFENPYGVEVNTEDIEFNKNRRKFKSIEENFKPLIDFDADLIIFAIGENVGTLLTEEKRQHFYDELIHLYNAINKSGKALVVVRSCFWPAPERDMILKKSCEAVNGIFVDISENGYLEKYYGRADRKWWHDGVAGHPGDAGMKMIADVIWNAIKDKI